MHIILEGVEPGSGVRREAETHSSSSSEYALQGHGWPAALRSAARVSAALRPIEGAGQIARYVVDITSRAPGSMTILERTVNGQPGLVAQQDGVTVTVFAFDVAGDRITHIWAARNPDKLRPWTAR